uniref:Ribonuclease H-like domain-containing protein n=1 Tax=Tanacetum cinerariifolium TaxID=118510 RepID=A0A6L2JMT4_TANCI|nr:ribonuclease H-like domain-containing protein [Tanacetum cinerariifolium]
MSTSNTHQQSLVDVGSETRPLMLERGPYVFKNYTPLYSHTPRLQRENVLTKDNLKHYEAEIEAINLILISIPNDIYNSVDACTTAQAMWQRVERLMRETVQNKVDRETRFNNEFDQFVVEPGEALVPVNTSRAKKLEKSHDPFALVAHTSSSFRIPLPYYVTHPSSVVDYDDYQGVTFQNNFEDLLTFAMMLLARVITQHFSNPTNNRLRSAANVQCYNCSEKGHYARNSPKPKVQDSKYFMKQMLLAKQDEAGVTLTDEQNDFLIVDASRMEETECHTST